ncbi:hypothetical protein ALC57_01147 [Trachymyrmex cornetzi]|uniref:Peptidase A2 domain-containing protein n=1 Tax=Trachymyrmex cornetzi TaxID=471704 RepID=A0A151JQA0_9HYME|nr:hypothetical protein ALC57_01147 [Trachymyrmex cornetzi]
MNFCFEGEVNNKRCNFRIDTGSDISILNDDLVGSDDFKVKINNCNLKYPTGEKVAIDYKMHTTVRLGNYLIEIPMLVAKINDDCILVEESFNIPSNLRSLFEKDSKHLNQSQKELFAKFFIEFREIFAEEIVAGNCEIGEHVINIKDSLPIKQFFVEFLLI